MNKLFTKVAALTLGVAMAAGVGVALGSAKASEAKATDYESTAFASLATGDVGVIVGNNGSNYALSNNNGTSSAPTATAVTVTNGKISDPAATLLWEVEKDGNNIKFKVNNGSNYLYCTNTNNGIRVGSNNNNVFTVSNEGYLLNSGTSRYVGIYNSADWRCYTSINDNIKNQTFSFYKTSGSSTTKYDVTDSVDNGTIDVAKVEEGATLTATITPDTGYNVPETVSVTMGGVAATNTYQNGVVTVENVTGNIVITGTCTPKPTPTHAGTSDDPYTVADAILAIDSGITGTKYVTGVVKEIVTPYSTQYSNITFNIVDNTTDTAFIQAFRCGGTDADKVAVGDTVIVSGSIILYQSKYELDSGCQLVSRTAPEVDTKYTVTFNSNGGTDPEAKEVGEGLVFTFPSAGSKEGYVFKGWTNDSGVTYYQEGDTSAPVNAATTYSGEWQTKGTQNTPYSVADALAAIAANAGIRGVYTTGIVKEIVTPYDSQYLNITFNIVDSANDTDFLQVFRCKGDDASKVAVGDIALVSGNLKLHNSTPEYDANCILESLVTPKTDWSDAEKTNFAAALDGLVPPFVTTTADPTINTETGFVDYYGEGDVKASYVSYFTENDWHDDLGGYYSKESPNGNGVITGYVGDATATGTYIYFQYNVYVIVTVVEGEDSNDYKIGSGSDFVLPQPTESSIPEGKQFKAWEVDSVEYDPGEKLEQVTSAVTVTAVYEDIPVAGWSSEMLAAFESVLHGIVPTYDESVSTLFYSQNYNDFEMAGAAQDVAAANLATLCQGWEEEDGEYYKDSEDGMGYANGYLYQSGSQYEVTITYVQTSYSNEMKALFAEKLNGNIPPFLMFSDFTWVADASMFASIQYTSASQLSSFQSYLSQLGFTLISQGTASRYVEVAGGALSGTVYQYAAYVQDGGILIFEVFVYANYYLFNNITYSAQPVSIALSGDYKTTFEYGEEFSAEGMVVTATMSDQSEQDVTSSAQFSGFDSLVEGEQTVTVTVGAVNTTYTVTVNEKVLESIAITSEPTKVEYAVGDEFDPTGLEVTATYNGGDPVVLDLADVEISGFDSTTGGEKTITVSFGGKSAEFTVTVAEAYGADQFAQELLEKVAPICANYDGKKSNKTALKAVWTEMALKYETLSEEEKAKVVEAAAKTDGTDLEKAMAFYNYACKKYGLTKFIAGRQVKAIVNEQASTGNSILPIIVIVAASVTAVTAIGVVIALKRRKNFLTK